MNEYQAFTPVTRPDGMPSQEFLLFLAALVAKINELEARLDAGGL